MQPTTRPTVRYAFAALLVLGLVTVLWVQRSRERAAEQAAAQGAQAEQDPRAVAGASDGRSLHPAGIAVQAGAPATADPSGAAGDAAARRERLRLAEERLQTYRSFAKYPPGSRPARENPDQLHPTAPVVRQLPLSVSGQPSQNIGLRLRQDKLTVVGSETIQLGIRCEDSQQQMLPCSALSATVSALPVEGAQPTDRRPVTFSDDPTPGRQGELVATLRPLELHLVERSWPLRVDVKLRAGRDPVEQGAALFDFLFTPDPPAVLTGKIREALVDGSLVLYYGLDVRRPGRYVVHARVDDAAGKELALLEWNDVLPAGPQELKLVVFGKLVLDEQPRMPLKVRDLDGFLLKEQGDPDRDLLAPLAGYHHTTRSYPASEFSAREWQSEERTRHEREYERDVEEARK